MKSREISRSKIGPFSLACTDPYVGIGWENLDGFPDVLAFNKQDNIAKLNQNQSRENQSISVGLGQSKSDSRNWPRSSECYDFG